MPRSSKLGLDARALKGGELYGILLRASAVEREDYPDTEIERKLFAAEDFFEHDLGIRLQETRVLSAPDERLGTADADITVNPAFDPLKDVAEPAYDYPPNLWARTRSALIKLRHGPVRSVLRVVFRWPGGQKLFKVPAEWITKDSKGSINITPGGSSAALISFNGFMLSLFSTGATLPHSIIIDYKVGFTPAELEYNEQDLVEAIRLRAVLLLGGVISQIVTNGGVQSESIGMDGLSHSRGLAGGKWGPYSGVIEQAVSQESAFREAWKKKKRGVPVAFA